MIVIVTGGRNYTDAAKVDAVLSQTGMTTLRHGGCKTGADALADAWARSRGMPVQVVPADWSQGRAAGPIRNRKMAAMGAGLCVAFPGGKGTADMVRQARAHGIPVLEVQT